MRAVFGFILGVVAVVGCADGPATADAESPDGAASAMQERTQDVCYGETNGAFMLVGDVWVVQADLCDDHGNCGPVPYEWHEEEADVYLSCGGDHGALRLRYLQ